MTRASRLLSGTFALTFAGLLSSAHASIVQISESAFRAGAGQISFSELPLGTVNPTYTPALYGGGAGSPTVTFGGYYVGQSLGSPSNCPSGAAVTGCVVGAPTGPLTLAPTAPTTFIATDGSNPDSPVLSGSPQFNGPIAIRFSTPQAGVGLIGGYFNNPNSTAITAFDAQGNVIGSVTNNQDGLEFLGLVTSNRAATIAGLEFHLVGDEPAGFAIDDIRFGVGNQVVVPSAVPLPASAPMFGAALLALGIGGCRLKRRARAAS